MLFKNGDSGIQVKYLQQALKIMCCNPGSIDSNFGPGTQAAVEKFQQDWGLGVDGIVGDVTWNCLVDEIIPIQQALKEKGYFSGAITGIAKDATFNAVIAFQKNHGLTADGMVGNSTRARLFNDGNGDDSAVLPLSAGDKGDYVLFLQHGLRILCCSPGSIDGVYGSATTSAVSKFQNKYSINPSGICDIATWSKLKQLIKEIQQRLAERGYHVPLVDGYASSSLAESIKQFQEANYLSADGQVGPATYDILMSNIPDGATDALPLKLNSRGPRVLYVQYALRISCINPNGTDGVYGSGTESAVKRYQTKVGITSNGIVDTSTWERMRKDIIPIQTALGNKGYDVGVVDGIATEKVYTAVLQYQTDNGLTADGMVGSSTKAMLLGGTSGSGTISSTLKPGSNGSLTLYLQKLFQELGYPVTLNGIFDTQTRDAAVAFQKANSLDADGVIGGGTWEKLFEAYQVDVPGTGVEKLINVAKHELEWEFKEDNANNITPYGQWYGMNGSAWCAMFVSYCAFQADVIETLVPKYAWCPSGMSWYKNRKQYFKRNSTYIPKRGDIIFFYNNELGRVAHTGIVIDGDENYITTIEGNTSLDRVQKCTYNRNHPTIDGYGSNGGIPIAEPPEISEDERLQIIYDFMNEVIDSLGFSIMPPFQTVLEQDIPLYDDPNITLTFKCSRGSTWYDNADSLLNLSFQFGQPTLGVNLTPYLEAAFEGVENKDAMTASISNLTLSAGDVPMKLEFGMEGGLMKISYIVMQTLNEGQYHEDVISYGITIWIKNNTELKVAMERVREYSDTNVQSIPINSTVVTVSCIVALLALTAATIASGGTLTPGTGSAAAVCLLILLNVETNSGGTEA